LQSLVLKSTAGQQARQDRAMNTRQQAAALAELYDAAKAPAQWSAALQRVAAAVGGIGAGQAIFNKRTGAVEWVERSPRRIRRCATSRSAWC
jgi:hypothetical protein